MGLSKLIYIIVIRVVLIIINAIAFAFYLINSTYLFIIINFFLLLIFQTGFLIFFIYNQFKKIERDIDLIEYSDSFINIKGTKENGVINIRKKISKLNDYIRTAVSKNDQKVSFLEGLLNHIDIALVCINSDGQFDLVNNSAKKLFNSISLDINERYFDKNDFFKDLKNIKVSEKIIYNLGPQHDNIKLLVSSFNFKMENEEKRIIALQNIKNQLETHENESWIKLSRYLTHEIMNSITPIVSTAKGINKLYLNKELIENELNKNEIDLINETLEGLEIIQERSEGLMSFISDYRDLFEIKKITKTVFNLEEFLKNAIKIFDDVLKEKNILLSFKITPSNIVLEADKLLIEQVIINLVKNAIQAKSGDENSFIKIFGFLNPENKIQINVIDNGAGIPEDIFDKIFIPFYSTKKEGSGIGLSIARFIIQLHGGQLNVNTRTGKTIFSLVF